MGLPASIQEELNALREQQKDTIAPPSGFKISTKNKVFTLPNGQQVDAPLEVIITDYRSANLYYKGVYNANDPKPPACYSISQLATDMKPSDNTTDPQSTSCNECAHNKWGSNPNGNGGKACKNIMRLAVLIKDPKTGDPMNMGSPWVVDVAPAGLKSFNDMVHSLDTANMIPIEVVTELTFANETYPKLQFKTLEAHGKVEELWNDRLQAQEVLDLEPNSQ